MAISPLSSSYPGYSPFDSPAVAAAEGGAKADSQRRGVEGCET